MPEEIKVFYSWQSDLEVKINRYPIRDCLKKAIKELNKTFPSKISLDHDTKERSGSPEIANTIFEKINECDVFVADISIINSNSENRKTPNPNVLIELGFAIKKLGWENIILLFNKNYGKVEELPFDLRGRRIMQFEGNIQALKANLQNAIQLILNDIASQKTLQINQGIDGQIEFFDLVKMSRDEYMFNYSINLQNLSKHNLKSPHLELYINNIVTKSNEIKDSKMLYVGMPIIVEKKFYLDGFDDTVDFKILFASESEPMKYSYYKVKFYSTSELVERGKSVWSENVFKYKIEQKKVNQPSS